MPTNVQMNTSLGQMTLELNAEAAPITVKNFLGYIEEGFYDGTIFHRVIPNFMIQGGGMDAQMQEKKNHPPIKNEAANGLKNLRGTIAMARTADPNSATSQFFINLQDNSFLDYTGPQPDKIGYAVFGKVVEGLDVLDNIAAVKTKTAGYYDDVPAETVEIVSVKKVDE